MFNKNFYPTPEHVISSMGIDCLNKVVLEPSAGKGDIIDYLNDNGAKSVLYCEINQDLSRICSDKASFIGNDFLKLTEDKISHVELIVMNPPFDKGVDHLIHAWNIAPDGCEIIALINNETIRNNYSRSRCELTRIISDYGNSVNLGDCFSESERSTDVEVALVKLYKPRSESREFEGFFMDEEEEPQGTGIMQYNSIRDAVNRYVGAVKLYDKHLELAAEMSRTTSLFNVGSFQFSVGYDETVVTREEFKKVLQKKAWKYLFDTMNLNKYVTSGVMKEINNFVENQTKVPFTMRNVYKMFDIIVGTREHTFNKSLEEAIDKLTMHTHENRYNVEGWKTNEGHLLNKKFIVPYMLETGFGSYLSPRYTQHGDKIQDLVKVLCSIEGVNFDEIPYLQNFCKDVKMQPNKSYDWGFFEIKGFKKGTMHLKFKNRDTWARLNQSYAKTKGMVLPEKI